MQKRKNGIDSWKFRSLVGSRFGRAHPYCWLTSWLQTRRKRPSVRLARRFSFYHRQHLQQANCSPQCVRVSLPLRELLWTRRGTLVLPFAEDRMCATMVSAFPNAILQMHVDPRPLEDLEQSGATRRGHRLLSLKVWTFRLLRQLPTLELLPNHPRCHQRHRDRRRGR